MYSTCRMEQHVLVEELHMEQHILGEEHWNMEQHVLLKKYVCMEHHRAQICFKRIFILFLIIFKTKLPWFGEISSPRPLWLPGFPPLPPPPPGCLPIGSQGSPPKKYQPITAFDSDH